MKKILVKFPSRERPHKFFLVLKNYFDLSHSKGQIKYLVTLDSDDPTISKYVDHCENLKLQGLDIEWVVGISSGKIHAINRDMAEGVNDWDILVLASDDMICKVQNWDVVLQNEMSEYFPDTDGVLYHNDGKTQLNTMCILGKKYYDRFGYIYHPDYISLWCDNEFMEVADLLGKQQRFSQVLFEHEHFSTHAHIQPDALMKRTQKFYHQDEAVYKRRKMLNFEIK